MQAGLPGIAIDRNCIEKRVRAVCERTAWRVFLFWWNDGCLAMILLAEIRLHERIMR